LKGKARSKQEAVRQRRERPEAVRETDRPYLLGKKRQARQAISVQ